MRQRTLIYIILTVIICVVVIASAIYVVDNMNSDTEEAINETNNTTDNNTTDNTTNESNDTSDNESSSNTDNDVGTTSTLDYSDYETSQYTDSDGVICLKDIGDRATYAEHKEWQQRQTDKLEADGYTVTASHRNGEDVDGYNALDSNGYVVVHIDA